MLQKLNDLVLLSLLVDCRVHFEMLRMKMIWSLERTSPFEKFLTRFCINWNLRMFIRSL